MFKQMAPQAILSCNFVVLQSKAANFLISEEGE
jgi:hypothetical protein